ncbi:LacI family DNA-binding transcriptional regulator [Nesterenkonia populi]|uniref:LacI family DNA-binding transcriptional regulator n=1 Tax=Nesterenkonia populi TaxID=1591087 RepID=UPI0011BE5204|nr:LacI family DNA-binding transcriptional regulator [Nesterenkonia populi]
MPDSRQPRRVRLKDVAEQAGVSVGTASDALSGRGRITEETRRKVADVASELGYVANALASGLRTGRTRTIGLHRQSPTEQLDKPYFRQFFAGVLEVGQRHDYDVSILSANTQVPRSTAPRVDGVIVVDPLSDDLRARELMLSPLPVVAGEHLPPGLPECEVVAVDHRRAVNELLAAEEERGVSRPLLVAPDEHSGWGNLLREVFEAWAADLGVEPAHGYVRFGGWDDKDGFRQVIRQLLEAHGDADFMLVSSPYGVLAGRELLLEAMPGREVRFASAGPDVDGVLSETPEVGYVDLPARALGAACAERLIERLEAGPAPGRAPGGTLVPASVRLPR